VLLVTGPRQVGKTTLLRRLAVKGRRYVTLDDPLALGLAREDPVLFLETFPPPLLLDEVQYAPGLLNEIKRAVDMDRTPGRFWLTGSQHFHLMKGVSESLAGRVAILHLAGLSWQEQAGRGRGCKPFSPTRPGSALPPARARVGAVALYRAIWRGSFPGIALAEKADRDLFHGSYVQTYLQRDVRDLARVGDEMAFLRFLRAAAARTAQILNLADLARDAGVAPNTAKAWLSILQASGLVYLLEPYHTNVTKRLVKAPKLYFLDTGLCSYLTQWSSPETLAAGAMSGAILESWVVAEILKSYWHNGFQAPLTYYRDKEQKEIDVLISQDGVIHPVEIKRSASPSARDAAPFASLARLGLPVGSGAVVCLVERSVPLTADVQAIPAWSM
jgi:hypothetical protein